MKKKILIIFMLAILLFSGGCGTKENGDALRFKKEYESLNGDNNYRSVTIDKDNPFVFITASELIKKIENKESFYVYFGDEMCPWCRSVIEASIKVAKNKKIDKIYYVSIWDEDRKEILRDQFTISDDGTPELISKGTTDYYKLLEYFNDILPDYTLINGNGEKVSVGGKRIFAPTFIYVNSGNAKKLVEGISSHQEESNDTLTDEIKADEEKIFDEFFIENKSCDDRC